MQKAPRTICTLTKASQRTKRGALPSVLVAFLLMVVFVVAALAVDIGHGVNIRSELQAACDAGALAGVQDVARYGLTAGDTYCQAAVADATTVCGLNYCERTPVVQNDPVTFVTIPDPQLNVTIDGINCNAVTVTATRNMNGSIFARIFGMNQAPISATATAVAAIPTTVQGTLPILPSMDYPTSGNNGLAMQTPPAQNSGDPGPIWNIILNGGGNNNAAWDQSVVQGGGKDFSTTSYTVGQTVDLNNGNHNNFLDNVQVGATYALPWFYGQPQYNTPITIQGFIGFQVISVNDSGGSQGLTGYLVPVIVENGSGGGSAGSNGTGNAYTAWHIYLVN